MAVENYWFARDSGALVCVGSLAGLPVGVTLSSRLVVVRARSESEARGYLEED